MLLDDTLLLAEVDEAFIVKVNKLIAEHYPPGEVDYPEVIRSLVSLAASYKRELHRLLGITDDKH